MGDRLTLLGTGTCQLDDRAASAVLIEIGAARIVFDFGRGVATRLAGLGLRQDDVRHVVLSHFHPDHLSDLVPYLQAAAHSRIDPRTENLTIWGPPGVEAQVGRLLELCGPGSLVAPERYRVVARTIDGARPVIGGHRFRSAELPPAGNRGLRLRAGATTVALTGDSDFHAEEIAFLRGADLAVFDAGHMEDGEIVELAVATGVPRMVCSHLYRALDLPSLRAAAAERGFSGELLEGRDLAVFEL